MNLYSRRRLFHRPGQNNVYRIFFYAIAIIASLWIVSGVERGSIQKAGLPTLTPTRAPVSFTSEAETRFVAGDIPGAIAAYKRATEIDPENAAIWAQLARIQAYSSASKTTDAERISALDEALFSADQAKALAPEDSTVAAVRAFVLDWRASYASKDQSIDMLTEAEGEATRALTLDNTNTLALIYYAEILIDQQKWSQGEQNLMLARENGANLMDWHRVYAYYLESQAAYSQAIEEYDRAIELAPNLTFLYIYAGANYRQLAFANPLPEQKKRLYERSLEYFVKAKTINDQLDVRDPIPYTSIAKTYSQTGDYFSAALNVQKALDFRPTDPDLYGQLGIVFRKSRNYEGSNMAFKCAIEGCNPEESCLGRYGRECSADFDEEGVNVTPLALSPNSIVYFYSYASNLAALSRPKDNKCPESRRVMKIIVEGGYATDALVSEILRENENICQIVDRGGILALITPSVTPAGGTPQPEPGMLYEATPTPTPTP